MFVNTFPATRKRNHALGAVSLPATRNFAFSPAALSRLTVARPAIMNTGLVQSRLFSPLTNPPPGYVSVPGGYASVLYKPSGNYSAAEVAAIRNQGRQLNAEKGNDLLLQYGGSPASVLANLKQSALNKIVAQRPDLFPQSKLQWYDKVLNTAIQAVVIAGVAYGGWLAASQAAGGATAASGTAPAGSAPVLSSGAAMPGSVIGTTGGAVSTAASPGLFSGAGTFLGTYGQTALVGVALAEGLTGNKKAAADLLATTYGVPPSLIPGLNTLLPSGWSSGATAGGGYSPGGDASYSPSGGAPAGTDPNAPASAGLFSPGFSFTPYLPWIAAGLGGVLLISMLSRKRKFSRSHSISQ